MYRHFVKPLIDFIMALIGSIILLIPMLILSIAIVIDDPGPVLFKQKRIGQKRKGKITYFSLYKFRSMKHKSTPHDMPTHMLKDPKQYITRVGGFIRKFSLDEIVQIPLNILTFKMSVVGPRPALWNQEDLVELREKVGANDVKPGLTGWAQINGRDELELDIKAKLDGDYAAAIKKGGFTAFKMDLRCFFGTFLSVFRHDGVVEGGVGVIKKNEESIGDPDVKKTEVLK